MNMPNPNSNVHPLDMAVPGFLPVISREAVEAALVTAAACKCSIENVSRFERKHYFYADLPLGYQITQQRWPLAKNGTLQCRRRCMNENRKKSKNTDDDILTVGIDRIQMEQDTGRTISIASSPNATSSLVDFDRAGCALVEIVFRPDIQSANDAALVVSTLRDLLRHIGTCDGRMEEGSLRCDLNLSIAPMIETTEETNNNVLSLLPNAGQRVEIKNLNSLQQIRDAALYEAKRQASLESLLSGQETRTYDVLQRKTVLLRTKEGAIDYRFLPEPDLPPLVLTSIINTSTIEHFIEQKLPESPEATLLRFMQDYHLTEDVAKVIITDPPAIVMFEEAAGVVLNETNANDKKNKKKISKLVANWLCNDLYSLVKEKSNITSDAKSSVESSTVSAEQLGELVKMIDRGLISNVLGKKILSIMFTEKNLKNSPVEIAKQHGWKLIGDIEELRTLCRTIVMNESNKKLFTRYQNGEQRKMIKVFMGKIMRFSKDRADPQLLQEVLVDILEE
eukprot:CAMPEP_0194152078 /NCGR_PEP_ID=MMETSP0152-20130528/50822_1 /TAXON_ID=1049557 /ORGANISM="Thalassiothrix antarctica, Strain L6-D1" /LENGTH=507 /DNA_ID=CAMNT_0038856319 /DNA_START=201 /DNA_END=1724 /DNA_ORIENTATION=+